MSHVCFPKKTTGTPDVVHHNNNGVTFVKIHPDGRLASLADGERGWIFGSKNPVFHGSKEDWIKFKKDLQEIGVKFRCEFLPVPFSNGTRNGDYFAEEYALRRSDSLPTPDAAEEAIAQAAKTAT